MSLADKRMTSFERTLNRREKQLTALKLLVVDEDHGILKLLETAFLAFGNCEVTTTSSTESALKIMRSVESSYDCFFVDITSEKLIGQKQQQHQEAGFKILMGDILIESERN